jgi:hypothetical protein
MNEKKSSCAAEMSVEMLRSRSPRTKHPLDALYRPIPIPIRVLLRNTTDTIPTPHHPQMRTSSPAICESPTPTIPLLASTLFIVHAFHAKHDVAAFFIDRRREPAASAITDRTRAHLSLSHQACSRGPTPNWVTRHPARMKTGI